MQTPFWQAPPAATQSAQATSASGGPQVVVVPASVGRAPPVPLPPIPMIPPIPVMVHPPLPRDSAGPASSTRAPSGRHRRHRPPLPTDRPRHRRGIARRRRSGQPPRAAGRRSDRRHRRCRCRCRPSTPEPPAPLSTGAPAPPDAVTTADSPDWSTRHPTPRSGTRTDHEQCGEPRTCLQLFSVPLNGRRRAGGLSAATGALVDDDRDLDPLRNVVAVGGAVARFGFWPGSQTGAWLGSPTLISAHRDAREPELRLRLGRSRSCSAARRTGAARRTRSSRASGRGRCRRRG